MKTTPRRLLNEDFDLSVYTPGASKTTNGGWFTRLNGVAEGWNRVTDFAGSWQGTFTMRADRTTLEDWFYNRLGYEVRERSYGVTTWEGFIWEMDYVTHDSGEFTRGSKRGKRIRRSYENLYNRVQARATGPNQNTRETVWFNDLKSQARYGVKEEILNIEGDQALANEVAQEFLRMSSLASPQVVGIEDGVEEPYLEVTVVGFVATANFRFVSSLDNVVTNVGSWISLIMTNDLDFLSPVALRPNTRTIVRSRSGDVRVWSLLEELTTLRDGSGNYFRLQVLPGKKITYREFQPTPIGLFFMGRFTDLSYQDIEKLPRLLKPGIYRGSGDPKASGRSLSEVSDNFLLSGHDMFLEAMEVTEEGIVIPRLGIYDDEEAVRSFVFPTIGGPNPPPHHEGDQPGTIGHPNPPPWYETGGPGGPGGPGPPVIYS